MKSETLISRLNLILSNNHAAQRPLISAALRSGEVLSYLSIDLVQPVLDGSLHVLLPVGEGERDAVSSGDDGHHLPVCTLPDKRIQRNHLQNEHRNIRSTSECSCTDVSHLHGETTSPVISRRNTSLKELQNKQVCQIINSET